MIINAHAHVFTFKTFLTKAAEDILKARITEHHLSQALANDLLRIVRKLFLGDNTPAVTAQCERYLTQRGLLDLPLFQFFKRGCLGSIDEVTDALVSDTEDEAETGEETLVVPLMLDVIHEEASDEDRALYRTQYAQTVAQAVRYPGRVLPFVSVNPRRGPEALDILHRALEEGECAGVKLYPSLGYTINDPMIDKIMAACQSFGAPITMHCNDGGFCGPAYDFTSCSPVSWRDVVASYDVRFNFAHCGDQSPAKTPVGPPTLWRGMILGLMDRYPDRIYADVSYQSGPLGDAGAKERYLLWLAGELASDRGANLLWGTDSFMIFLSCLESTYWRFFRQGLAPALFRRLGEDNPKRFLGLPHTPGQAPAPGSLLERHVAFLRRQKEHNPDFASASHPAAWIAPLLD